MKEATGELNMTVVTVVAIAAIIAFFYAFIWPGIKVSLARNTCSNMCPEGVLDSSQGNGGVDVDSKTCFCGDKDNTIIKYGDAEAEESE